jgi:hypothetical protein
MTSAGPFYTLETPADTLEQVSAMLGFLSEALAGMACRPDAALSSHGLDGLSIICAHLRMICQEAAAR